MTQSINSAPMGSVAGWTTTESGPVTAGPKT
jgi:hypothetical protein